MLQENPYQSPESDPAPPLPSPADDLVHRRWPTWRFWVLFLICVPGFLLFALPIQYFAAPMGPVRNHYYYTVPYSIVVFFFLAICALLFIRWRSAARLPSVWPGQRRIGFFLGALTILSLFAATSAFTSICATTVVANGNPPRSELFLMIAIPILSSIGPLLVVFLARGLYLDAIGRPKKPTEDLPQRPIPRLQTRRPPSGA